MSDERIIYHITPADYYNSQAADQPYVPQRFAEEGFIHCTRGEERTLLVANTIYRKTPGKFLLLVIDEQKVKADIRNEIVGEILFPHIYGPLNREAIIRVQEMARAQDGTFLTLGEMPESDDLFSVHPAALATAASIEDVLVETRRLRKYATERIVELEQEIEAFRQGRPAPTTRPAAQKQVAPVAAEPANLEELAKRLAKLEQRVTDLQSLLVDRIDKLDARIEAQTRKRAAASRKTKGKTAKKPGKMSK